MWAAKKVIPKRNRTRTYMVAVKRPGWETSADAREIQDEIKTSVYKEIKDIKWEPHPINDKLKLAFLLTKKG